MTSPEVIFTICRRTTASPYYILKSLFLWKPWINKLVTLCSPDHFQFEFLLISHFFIQWPRTFSGRKFAFRNGGRIDFSQFSSLWMLLWVFIPTSFPRFSLDMAGNTPTLQCKAAVSSVRKLLRVHSRFENALYKCGKWQTVAKYIENKPDTLCIQLSTSGIKRIGFIRFTNNCH